MDMLLRLNLVHLRRLDRSPATIYAREQIVGQLVAWLGKPLAEATSDDIARWTDSVRARVSVSSLCTYIAHVWSLYGWAFDFELIERNPCVRVPRPSRPSTVPRPIPEKDLRTGLLHARGQLVPILVIGAYAGLRASEIAGVRREHAARDDDGVVRLWVCGKGRKERIVPLVGPVWDVVEPWLVGPRGPAFIRPKGTPATGHFITRTVSDHFAGLGLPFVAHQLRHRFGTALFSETRDLRLVQELLGHASPGVTAGYVHVGQERQAAGMRKLARGLDRRPSGNRPPEDGSAATAA